MIKVVIVDDQMLFRESIGYILDNDEEIEVLAIAGTGEEAVDICLKHRPDMVLMDIEMPGLDGVDATLKIKKSMPSVKVVMLTTFENSNNIMESFSAGADGYIVKNISHRDLVAAVKCVAGGLSVIHESVKTIMVEKFKELYKCKLELDEQLDEVELEIVRMIATGKGNRDIAKALNYSEGTIKNKISRLFEKLNVKDRIQIAIFAIENGIV